MASAPQKAFASTWFNQNLHCECYGWLRFYCFHIPSEKTWIKMGRCTGWFVSSGCIWHQAHFYTDQINFVCNKCDSSWNVKVYSNLSRWNAFHINKWLERMVVAAEFRELSCWMTYRWTMAGFKVAGSIMQTQYKYCNYFLCVRSLTALSKI